MEYEKNYKGRATGGLTTGIIGTALGVLNGAGGLLGGVAPAMARGAACEGDHIVNRYELGLEQANASKDAEISLLKANIYGDQKLLEVYKYFDGKLEGVNARLAEQAVVNQANKDSFGILQERMECCKNELSGAICRERDDRRCADNTIVTYLNATFYPKQVADVTVGTTTTPQTTYNPLPVYGCGGGCGTGC